MCNGALLGFHAGQPEAVVKVLEPVRAPSLAC
jgi:hypothetical protein